LKSKTIIQLKNEHLKPVLVAEYTQNLRIYEYNEEEGEGEDEEQKQQQNYFLICESCFWMASTLSPHKSKNNLLPVNYTKCPLCDNKIDQFAISSILN
jgi:hypothetical protein